MGGGADGLDPYPQLASGCYLAKYVYAWRFAARTPTPYPQPFGHRTKLGCIDTIAMSFQPRPSSKHTYFERYNVSAALMPPLERHEQRHPRNQLLVLVSFAAFFCAALFKRKIALALILCGDNVSDIHCLLALVTTFLVAVLVLFWGQTFANVSSCCDLLPAFLAQWAFGTRNRISNS